MGGDWLLRVSGESFAKPRAAGMRRRKRTRGDAKTQADSWGCEDASGLVGMRRRERSRGDAKAQADSWGCEDAGGLVGMRRRRRPRGDAKAQADSWGCEDASGLVGMRRRKRPREDAKTRAGMGWRGSARGGLFAEPRAGMAACGVSRCVSGGGGGRGGGGVGCVRTRRASPAWWRGVRRWGSVRRGWGRRVRVGSRPWRGSG